MRAQVHKGRERQAIRFIRNARFKVTPGGKLRPPKIGEAAPTAVTVMISQFFGSSR